MNTNKQPCTVNTDILMFAFRYTIDRQTGVITDVIEQIKNNISSFQSWEIGRLNSESAYHIRTHRDNVDEQNKINILIEFTDYLDNINMQRLLQSKIGE